jgi:hypothetical protein
MTMENLKEQEEAIYKSLGDISDILNASAIMQQYAGFSKAYASRWFYRKLRREKMAKANKHQSFSDADLKLLQGTMLNLANRLMNISIMIRKYLEDKKYEKS